jgi:hypothetical protein
VRGLLDYCGEDRDVIYGALPGPSAVAELGLESPPGVVLLEFNPDVLPRKGENILVRALADALADVGWDGVLLEGQGQGWGPDVGLGAGMGS